MHFIVNPTAGSGKAKAEFEKVCAFLDSKNIAYTMEYTTAPGSATISARNAVLNNTDIVVAVGGDGTVREVASAIAGTDTILGILPFGTGNDLVKALKIPTDAVHAAETLLKRFVRRMDAAKLNDKWFFNVAGMGFDVDVLLKTDRFKSKFKNGMMPYFMGIVSSLLHKRKIPMDIRIDGEDFGRDILIMDVANGTHFGGGMKVAPDADIFDGYFDVVIIRNVGLFRFLTLLPRFIKGTHVKVKKFVEVVHAKRVEVSTKIECRIQSDGEVDNFAPAIFEMFAGCLQVIVPEDVK